jgi:hypothetical protein
LYVSTADGNIKKWLLYVSIHDRNTQKALFL